MASPGETVFTDVYEDALTGQNVVTVACAGSTGNVVLAFDLYPENFVFQYEQQDLPEGASFFLCDGVGNILYSETSFTHEDGLDAYILDLVHRIEAGELEDATSYVIDLDGRERAVDYSRLANGWYSIVTAPRAVILGRLQSVGALFGIMVALFAVLLGALAVRDMRRARTMERTNETVRVLGNSYYAIYLVNYEEGTYEMIKGSDYVRRRIPKRGPYESLLRTAAEVIERDTFEEFEESFSADNIRNAGGRARARLRRRLPAALWRQLPLGQRAGALRRVARSGGSGAMLPRGRPGKAAPAAGAPLFGGGARELAREHQDAPGVL